MVEDLEQGYNRCVAERWLKYFCLFHVNCRVKTPQPFDVGVCFLPLPLPPPLLLFLSLHWPVGCVHDPGFSQQPAAVLLASPLPLTHLPVRGERVKDGGGV